MCVGTSTHERCTSMPDIMLTKLKDERESKLKFVEDLANTAAADNRDLSTNELELITRSNDRVDEIDGQLKVLARESKLDEESQTRLAQLAGATIGGGNEVAQYRTAGAYLSDYLTTIIGEGEKQTHARERLTRYHRAAAHVTTGNFTGVFPQAIVGPLISLINTSRPLVSALGTIDVPSGPSFRRPKLN